MAADEQVVVLQCILLNAHQMSGQVEQLVAVTGVSKEMATNLLEACGGNLEMAVRNKC